MTILNSTSMHYKSFVPPHDTATAVSLPSHGLKQAMWLSSDGISNILEI